MERKKRTKSWGGRVPSSWRDVYFVNQKKSGTKVNWSRIPKKDKKPDFNTGRFGAWKYTKPHSAAADRSMNTTTLGSPAIAIPSDALAFVYDYCFCKMILLLCWSIVATKVRCAIRAKKGQKNRFQYREIQGFSHIFIFTFYTDGIWCAERVG